MYQCEDLSDVRVGCRQAGLSETERYMRHIPKTAAPCKHVRTQTHTYKHTHTHVRTKTCMHAQTHAGKRPKVFSIFTHFSKSPPDSCFGDSITICSQGLKMNKHQQAEESATKNVIAEYSRIPYCQELLYWAL